MKMWMFGSEEAKGGSAAGNFLLSASVGVYCGEMKIQSPIRSIPQRREKCSFDGFPLRTRVKFFVIYWLKAESEPSLFSLNLIEWAFWHWFLINSHLIATANSFRLMFSQSKRISLFCQLLSIIRLHLVSAPTPFRLLQISEFSEIGAHWTDDHMESQRTRQYEKCSLLLSCQIKPNIGFHCFRKRASQTKRCEAKRNEKNKIMTTPSRYSIICFECRQYTVVNVQTKVE